MQTVTTGHLSSNGGVRGHSAGDFYPYRVMVQGTFQLLTWWVIDPQGDKVQQFNDSSAACEYASLLYNFSIIG